MMKFISIFFLIFFTTNLFSQTLEYYFPGGTEENRAKKKLEMEKVISSELDTFQSTQNENTLKKSFEFLQILNINNPNYKSIFKSLLIQYQTKSESFLFNLLETIYTIAPTEFEIEIKTIQNETLIPKVFTMSTQYLLRIYPEERKTFSSLLKSKFKNYDKVPILKILNHYLEKSPSDLLKNRPPLKDLLSHDFGENTFIVFSLHRANRDYPGIAIIKKNDGKFLRREDGSFFTVSQLARSVSDLPSYVVNGNTPQGIFSIQKILPVKNESIGPSPALITALPFEISPDKFFHSTSKSKSWSIQAYLDLLPTSWQSYFPIKEAYFAGEIGRNAIFAHGTSIDTDFYKGNIFFPNSPTRGCISSKEIWSRNSGKCLYSDQLILIGSIKKLNIKNGYMIVIEIDDENRPVSLDDILLDILEVEEFAQ